MTSLSVQPHLGSLVHVVDGRPHLVGSRCERCATESFPAATSCSRCGAEQMVDVSLAPHGQVWTWTVQRFAPKPPFRAADSFEPFALGYVDLGTVRVESRLKGKPVDAWRIGDEVQLAIGPMNDGDEWQAFWFEPREVAP
jgi:uncharacterized protein